MRLLAACAAAVTPVDSPRPASEAACPPPWECAWEPAAGAARLHRRLGDTGRCLGRGCEPETRMHGACSLVRVSPQSEQWVCATRGVCPRGVHARLHAQRGRLGGARISRCPAPSAASMHPDTRRRCPAARSVPVPVFQSAVCVCARARVSACPNVPIRRRPRPAPSPRIAVHLACPRT
jgi:hypothetical protein